MHLSSTKAALALGLGVLQTVYAHTCMDRAHVNGEPLGAGTCVRLNQDGYTRNNFVSPISSNDMACGIDGEKGVSRVCPIKGGDTVTFEWNAGDNKEGHIAKSHMGPCSVMMKKVNSALTDPGHGDGWFRIFYEGYNKQTGKWCTERMMDEGLLSVTIPADLKTGDYLIRSELLALHSASQDDPQFYVSCLQVILTQGGTAEPQNTVALPSDEYAKLGTPSMNFNYYYPPGISDNYTDYGPPTYVATGAGGGNQVTQTEGQRPGDCIFEAGNWCGKENPTYSDQDGCWKSAEQCWAQHDSCWKSVFIDNTRCEQWRDKCERHAAQCQSGNYQGPPDAGKDLTPPPQKRSCPPPVNDAGVITNTGNTGSSSSSSASASTSSTATADSGSGSSSSTPSATPTSNAGYGYGSGSASSSSSASPSATSTANAGSGSGSGSDDYGNDYAVKVVSSPSTSLTASTSTSTANAGSGSSSSSSISNAPASSETPAPTTSCVEVVTETVTETATTTVTAKPKKDY